MRKVLIPGAGGREHAIGWKLAQSDEVSEVIYAPGNAGTGKGVRGRNIPIDGSKKENFQALIDIVNEEDIDMVVVGPEQPLASGIVDFFNSRGYNRIFGPTAEQARLEADKFYSYALMEKLHIPQAESITCESLEEVYYAIEETEKPVLKHRWLAEGKGVRVYNSQEEALLDLGDFMKAFGGETLVAKRLYGEEFSVFSIADGKSVVPLEMAFQDHKPLLDDDKGPNTGGMGAYGPAPFVSSKLLRKITDEVLTPVVQQIGYQGFLYAGMIMTAEGPKVLEFNVRFGDPECQPAMMMLKSDLYPILSSALEGKLDHVKMEFNPGASCCVVLASQGYPKNYKKGLVISGLDDAEKVSGVKVFHAGTKLEKDQILTAGGRVLGVTAYSPNGIADAQKLAYESVSKISIPEGFHYRKDIANKALK